MIPTKPLFHLILVQADQCSHTFHATVLFRFEMGGSQPKQNSLPIVLNRSIDATATLDSTSVIPIQQHPNQIFHQIQIQQPQPQIHQTQQVIQQHTQGTSNSNQPITE